MLEKLQVFRQPYIQSFGVSSMLLLGGSIQTRQVRADLDAYNNMSHGRHLKIMHIIRGSSAE